MVALLPPYVETAPQLCEFEGSEIDGFGSKINGFGVTNQKRPAQTVFFDFFTSSKGPHLSDVPNFDLHYPPPHRIN